MANNAIITNPSNATIHITEHGSDWLWAVCGLMFFADLVVLGWHFTVPRGSRAFHQIGAMILTTAGIAYFCMASDLGSTPIATEFAYLTYPVGTSRQIWYVRYIDWVITTPLLLLELVLASGLPLSDIITLIFFDEVMIITGLVGALVASSYKWGFFTFAMFALFYIWWVLLGPGRASAGVLGAQYQKSFTTSAAILSVLWLLYPVAWGLSDGSSYITPDSEMIFYGVLDVLAKPVFIFIHLFSLSKLDLTALQLSSGKFSASAAGVSVYDREANAPMATHAAVGEKKRGMFGKKGRYDAQPVAAPRMSEATVV